MTQVTNHKSWSEVLATHRSQSGISLSGGRVRSLLCNQNKAGEYGDEVRENQIFYRVTRSTPLRSVLALKDMVGGDDPVRVFEKLEKNRWIDHGVWLVANAAIEEPDGMLFLLERMRANQASPPEQA
jgi:hypothetical protein